MGMINELTIVDDEASIFVSIPKHATYFHLICTEVGGCYPYGDINAYMDINKENAQKLIDYLQLNIGKLK